LLEEARAADPSAAIVVLSCRKWPAGDLTIIPIGSPKANSALVDARIGLEGGRHVIRASAVNLSDAAIDGRVGVWNRGLLLRSDPIRLVARERKEISYQLDPATVTEERFAALELRLESDDPRPVDDAAGFILPSTKPVTVGGSRSASARGAGPPGAGESPPHRTRPGGGL
jgi:hypothetical protein